MNSIFDFKQTPFKPSKKGCKDEGVQVNGFINKLEEENHMDPSLE